MSGFGGFPSGVVVILIPLVIAVVVTLWTLEMATTQPAGIARRQGVRHQAEPCASQAM